MYDVSAGIVIYNANSVELDNACRCFMDKSDNLKKHLYIIDNLPGGTQIPKWLMDDSFCDYMPMKCNIGFGSGHNRALDKAINESKYHLIMNSDINYNNKLIEKIYKFMNEDKGIIACMPKILDKDGKMQYMCKLLPTPFDLIMRRFLPNIALKENLNSKYELRFADYNKVMNVPTLSGCFLMLRCEEILKNKLRFDERYFMYLEDFDFIRRCHRVGKTVYFPGAEITHYYGKYSYKNLQGLSYHINSAIKYFNKYGWFIDNERREVNAKTIRELKGK